MRDRHAGRAVHLKERRGLSMRICRLTERNLRDYWTWAHWTLVQYRELTVGELMRAGVARKEYCGPLSAMV